MVSEYIYIRKTELKCIHIYKRFKKNHLGLRFTFEMVAYINIQIYISCHLKTEAQAIFQIRLPFAHRGNGRLSFFRLLTTQKINGSYPFANVLNGLAHRCIYAHVTFDVPNLQFSF